MHDWKEYVGRRLRLPELRPEREAEIIEDLAAQLEAACREALAGGAAPEQAAARAEQQVPDWAALAADITRAESRHRRDALEQAGARVAERGSGRSTWVQAIFGGIARDTLYGLRLWRRSPGFTAVAVLTLALGIGANASMFSMVNALLFRPLPAERPEELVDVYNQTRGRESHFSHEPMAYPDYRDLRDAATTLRGLAAYALVPVALEHGDRNEQVLATAATGNYFELLGVRAALGRTFTAEEDAQPVLVLSHAAWQRRFAGDPGVVGRTLRVNGHTLTVLGVAPAEFPGLMRGIVPELWLPMALVPALNTPTTMSMNSDGGSGGRLENRGRRWLWVVGRLRPGAGMEQAGEELAAIGRRLQQDFPETNRERTVVALPSDEVRILPGVDRLLYGASFVLLGVVGIVLLTVCSNVAGLLLARATARRKEVALRLALGAGRARLVRQMLTESLLLAGAGALAGLGMVALHNRLFDSFHLPWMLNIHLAFGLALDYRVLAYTLLVATVAAVLFGLAPALEASRTDLAGALKEDSGGTGGRRRRRTLDALAVGQVAFSLVLLVAAGLSLRSMYNARVMDPGFDSRGVVVGTFTPELVGYDRARRNEFFDRLAAAMETLPGVDAAVLTDTLPLTLAIGTSDVAPEGMEGLPRNQWPEVDNTAAGPGYFRLLRIPVLHGREFTLQDGPGAQPVMVVNEAFAERFWPGQDPLGKTVRTAPDAPPAVVVGVVGNAKYRTLGEAPRPYYYRPVRQQAAGASTVLVRAAGDPGRVIAALREQARLLDPRVPATGLRTLEEAVSVSLLLPETGAKIFGMFGGLATLLAAVGLYGVLAYTVAQRTREIGIRMALGAAPGDVLRLVLRRVLALTLAGAALGLAGAAGLAQVLGAVLYGVSPTDPLTYAGVTLLLVAVALAACWGPMRRAMRVDPLTALRHE